VCGRSGSQPLGIIGLLKPAYMKNAPNWRKNVREKELQHTITLLFASFSYGAGSRVHRRQRAVPVEITSRLKNVEKLESGCPS